MNLTKQTFSNEVDLMGQFFIQTRFNVKMKLGYSATK